MLKSVDIPGVGFSMMTMPGVNMERFPYVFVYVQYKGVYLADLKDHRIFKITNKENHGWMLMEKILFFSDPKNPEDLLFVAEEKKEAGLYRIPAETIRNLREIYI